ncbi:hypothetical protein LUZ60_002958 [Juncus effusus]|nr:hypothetical protein LUZ60_002958 [Juncus effusus]
MVKHDQSFISKITTNIFFVLRKCLFSILSFGPVPTHIAFIMDGNRRYAKRHTGTGTGHNVGFKTLISTLQYCYEMGVKCVTVYAFSIDNFKRDPLEVQSLMHLMQEKIEELLQEESLVQKYQIRINFWGDLQLLNESVRLSAEKAMNKTKNNKGPVFSICVAYTSTNEIVNSVEKSCRERREKVQKDELLKITDLERNLYSNGCKEPDLVIRTSGETRLSNFLLWQTGFTHLQNPDPLWPQFGLRNLVWSVLEYQRVFKYLEKRKERDGVLG